MPSLISLLQKLRVDGSSLIQFWQYLLYLFSLSLFHSKLIYLWFSRAICSIPAPPNSSSTVFKRGDLSHPQFRSRICWPILGDCPVTSMHVMLCSKCSFLAQSPTNNSNPFLFVKCFVFFKTHTCVYYHI